MNSLIKKGLLTKQELKLIRAEVSKFADKSRPARIGMQNVLNTDIRNSDLYFPITDECVNSRNILQSIIIQEYIGTINVDLSAIAEFQYLKYAPGGFYNWHNDVISVEMDAVRGLTLSLNITDDNMYTGGSLLVKSGSEVITNERKAGSYIIFPSFLEHKASPVISGTREAVVVWSKVSPVELQYLHKKYKDKRV